MADNINLDDYAEGTVQDAIYDMHALDIDLLRERTRDAAYEAASNACIYTHNCRDIIARYEADDDAGDAADLCLEGTYTAVQWEEAMVAYASAVASCVVTTGADRLVDLIGDARDVLFDASIGHGCKDGDDLEPRVTRECPHGWAVHDKEDKDGVHYWSEPQLEGCRAVAVRTAGIWLSYTWTPAEVAAEAASEGEA